MKILDNLIKVIENKEELVKANFDPLVFEDM